MLLWALDTKGAKILPCGSTGSARTAVPGGFCPGRRSVARPSMWDGSVKILSQIHFIRQ